MDQLAKIKEAVLPLLSAHDIQLYDVCWTNEGRNKILQIAIMHEDGSMDIDGCAEMAELISEKLDEIDVIAHEYMLEVCSPGAERVLRTLDEIKGAVNEYIYAKFISEIKGLREVKGDLLAVEDDELLIAYMDKAVKRQLRVSYQNLSLIRLSVRI